MVQNAEAAPIATQKTATYDPAVLLFMCLASGGTWSPPSTECNGCFYCVFPDGTLIACDGDHKCSISEKGAPLTGYRLFGEMTKVALAAQNLAQAPADLVALPTPATFSPEGFCRRNDQGQLLVNVYNQGRTDAAASKLRVIFGSADPVDFDTPAIAAGTGTDVVIDIPDECFDQNTLQCSFTLGVDATNVVAEWHETNNNAEGLCGPQFE
jgi:hypothetical protein